MYSYRTRQGVTKSHIFFRLSVRFQKPAPPQEKPKAKEYTPVSPPPAAFASPIVKKIPLEHSKKSSMTPSKHKDGDKLLERTVPLDFVLLAPFATKTGK